MTDLIITEFGDTWINADTGKTTTNYGSTGGAHVRLSLRRALLLPSLPNIAGRTVLSATLSCHAAAALVSQQFSLGPCIERWSPGKATWANQPDIDAGEIILLSPGAIATDGLVEFDVTDHIQAVADGTDWFGWRLGTNSSTVLQVFRTSESGLPAWELHLTLSDTPDQPTDLRPDGGGNITSNEPILSWVFDDAGLDTTSQAQSQVQVDTPAALADPDDVAPDYDSGYEANVVGEWDLDGEHTVTGAGPHYWRVRVKDGDGNESAWSDWAEFGVLAKPSLVVDAPTGAIGDPAPTVLAHLSSGSIASWYARVTGSDRADIRARTGTRTGAVSWQVPLTGPDGRRVLRDEVQSWIYLRVYPAGDWATAVGETAYLETWISVVWDDDLGIVAPTDLNVFQSATVDPVHRWVWECTDAPESFLLIVDGETIIRVAADDDELDVSAGVWTYTDYGQIAPLRPHTLQVRAVADDGRSEAATQNSHTHTVKGMWILPDAAGIDPILVDGTSAGGFTRTDYRANYVTSTGDEIDIFYGTPGRKAQFEGSIDARDSADDLWARVAGLEALQSSKVRTGRLVWGSQSSYGRFRDVDVTSDDELSPTNLRHKVRFEFIEALG